MVAKQQIFVDMTVFAVAYRSSKERLYGFIDFRFTGKLAFYDRFMVAFIDFQVSDSFANPDLHPCYYNASIVTKICQQKINRCVNTRRLHILRCYRGGKKQR